MTRAAIDFDVFYLMISKSPTGPAGPRLYGCCAAAAKVSGTIKQRMITAFSPAISRRPQRSTDRNAISD